MFSLSTSIPLSIAGMVLVGLGTIAQAVSTNMAIQKRVPDDRRGRVLSIYTAMFIGANPIGSLFFGWVGQFTGAAHALLAGAIVAAAGAAFTASRMRG
jgi:predicted MFS family arabinose efflux permease